MCKPLEDQVQDPGLLPIPSPLNLQVQGPTLAATDYHLDMISAIRREAAI
jgi:hypothetical protein